MVPTTRATPSRRSAGGHHSFQRWTSASGFYTHRTSIVRLLPQPRWMTTTPQSAGEPVHTSNIWQPSLLFGGSSCCFSLSLSFRTDCVCVHLFNVTMPCMTPRAASAVTLSHPRGHSSRRAAVRAPSSTATSIVCSSGCAARRVNGCGARRSAASARSRSSCAHVARCSGSGIHSRRCPSRRARLRWPMLPSTSCAAGARICTATCADGC